MYEAHANFETPPDTTELWRYVDIGRFMGLLDTGCLYFARIAELEDPWEAAHPAALTNYLSTHLIDKEGRPALPELFQYFADSAAVSCWHENHGESIAMWSLYNSGNEGVAIRTTVGRLKNAFAHEPRAVLIGRVTYIDYETDTILDSLNVMSPLMNKRRSFSHEAEVRAIIPYPQIVDEASSKLIRLSDSSRGIPALRPGGVSIRVSLASLLDKVVVSPKFPLWALPAIQKVVDSAGLSLTVEVSDLLKSPPGYPRIVTETLSKLSTE